MFNKCTATFVVATFLSAAAFAQNIVSVNQSTGTANVNIPLFNLANGQVSVPISISYSATGVKPKDQENTAGMGWQFNSGGGGVSRVVRGLPDDVSADISGDQRLGWMNPLDTAAGKTNFTIANNGGTTCADETTDLSYLNTYIPFRNDSEPDLFYVSAPGLIAELVYVPTGTSPGFQPVIYQDLKISYTTNSTSHLITSFTITNNQGITYVFGNASATADEQVVEWTFGGSGNFFQNKYKQYQNGIAYYDNWSLVSITDAHGNGFQYNYGSPLPKTNGADSIALYPQGSTTPLLQYYDRKSVTPYQLQSIQTIPYTSNSTLNFTWQTSPTTGQSYVQTITGQGRTCNLGYTPVVYTPTGFNRYFLTTYSETGCGSPISYTFSYAGSSYNPTSGQTSTTLPDSTSNQYDFWGYYSTAPGSSTSQIPSVYVNPSNSSYPRYLIGASSNYNAAYQYYLSNTARMVDPTNIATGSLNQITYANGGTTSIVYQPNDYYDPPTGTTIQGNGIRVSQITHSPGPGATNNIVVNYSYLNPSTGLSSGKPLSLPQYAFTMPGASGSGISLWEQATVLSAQDLSHDDHTIMYANVKVSQTGAGYTTYNFYEPGSYYDVSATPDCSGCTSPEWYPTEDYEGRTNCSGTGYGPVVTDQTYLYPFLPNPNYDFERGILQSVVNYNDSGSEVSESDYTYIRSYSPIAMSAVRWETNGAGTYVTVGYGKYTQFYNVSELTASVTNKVYDSGTLSQTQSSTVNYTYGSSYHRLPTKIQTTNSDNSSETSNISYAKDFTASAGNVANPNIAAIYNLIQQNINAPIESYRQVTPSGGSATTTSAQITLFRDTTIASVVNVIPASTQSWVQPAGGSFTPMTISGNTFTLNGGSPGYFTTVNFDIYDNTGFARTSDDSHKHIQTTLLDHYSRKATAVFKNAAYNQVAFSDFDTDPASPPSCAFTISGTEGFTPTSGHAGNAYGLASTQTVTSPTISKSSLALNYIFSIWTNATTGGTLTVTVNSTPYSITYSNSGTWIYHELSIPAASLASSFTFTFVSSGSVAIDDILFYPDNAEASTATYDAVAGNKIAETNTNGVSAYFTYDTWSRLLFAYDQNYNITKKNVYISPTDAGSMNSPAIDSGAVVNGQATAFTVTGPDNCAAAGSTVTWNFGDGSGGTYAGLTSPNHTYTGIGNSYTVQATVNSPLFGTIVVPSDNITVQAATIPLSYVNYGTEGAYIGTVTFTPIGSGTYYSFTTTQLNSAHVLQGDYTIQVQVNGGLKGNPGYASIQLNGGSAYNGCANEIASGQYTFTANISNSTSLAFYLLTTACP